MGAYMGLVKQCDDQMGVLFDYLEKSGRMEDTLIVVTSDHGDFLGDHWLGEKTFFQNASVKVPMIIYDPSAKADATRGTTSDALVECIDLVPTFVEVAGTDPATLDHILEGQSLLPMLRGGAAPARDFVICEYDYSTTPLAARLDIAPKDARMFMVADRAWKMIHFESGHRPMLFDLGADPDEVVDLGADPDKAEVIDRMYDMLFDWLARPAARTTISNAAIRRMHSGGPGRKGVVIGAKTARDISPESAAKYLGRKAPDMRRKTEAAD